MSRVGELPAVGPGPGQMSHCTEIYDICPYNPSHSILRYRMQTHLHKCRQSYPLEDREICQYNSTHHVPRKEMTLHLKTCSSYQDFLRGMVKVSDLTDKPIVPQYEIDLPEPEENWDDGAVGGYDPKVGAEKKNLIRGIHGAPPSERKDFKLKHRKHIQELEAEEALKGPVKTKTVAPNYSQQIPEDEPLRRPKDPPQTFLRLGRGMGVKPQPEVPMTQPGAECPAPPPSTAWLRMGRGRGLGPAPAPNVPLPPSNPWCQGAPKF